MKRSVSLSFLILGLVGHFAFAGDTLVGSPPGYTNAQLRFANGLVVDPSGSVWIAFPKIGLARYDGSAWTVYDSLNSPLLKNNILSVAANAAGVWAGTDTGLFHFDGASWSRLTVANSGLFSDVIPGLYTSGGSDLCIYSASGFSSLNGSTWQHYNTGNSGIVSDSVRCMYREGSGVLWVGTKHGLSRFDGSNWQSFTTSNSALPEDDIRVLCGAGTDLFAYTAGTGLWRFNGTAITSMTEITGGYSPFPPMSGKLFRMQNGKILYSSFYDYFIEAGPVSVKIRSGGFFASDTLHVSAIDSQDRLWRFSTLSNPKLYMRDSVEQYTVVDPPADYAELDINQVRCGMFNDNIFHWDQIGSARYEVPKNLYRNSVFASGLWIGGLDADSNLHMAAQTYRQSGRDFWPGPLDTISATIDSAALVHYDSIWKINRHTIDEFITQFNLGNVTNGNYPVPGVIVNWPAHGTGNYSRGLAPFVDHNSDGIYNPMNGDYPAIKGDQMLWFVMNDNGGYHGETDGVPLGLEVRASAYAYNCSGLPDSFEVINYTTFYSIDMINRSDTDYHDVYIGLYVDVDLGNYLDDYIGCNVPRDIGFGYNGDNNDEGTAGYGLNPPMINAAFLKGPLSEPGDSIDNNHDGTVDESGEHCMMNHFLYYDGNNDPCVGNPGDAEDFYGYLQSVSRCGFHFTYGGNGHGGGMGSTAVPTDYFYPGIPYDTGWTETTAGNLPDDRRFLMSSGPFSLRKGETRSLDYAIIYTRDASAPNGLSTSITKNFADVDKIKHWFDTDSFPCNNSSIGIQEIQNAVAFSVYPNPATDAFYITLKSESKKLRMELSDVTGRILHKQNLFSEIRNRVETKLISPGIYFVRLMDGTGQSVQRIIKR